LLNFAADEIEGGSRDRTLIRVMTYAFARVGAWPAPGPHGDGPVLDILVDQ
jgi:hypothetical protein